MKRLLPLLLLLLVTACAATLPKPVFNFDECVAAGNPVMESSPRQCKSAEGDIFVEEVSQSFDLDRGVQVVLPVGRTLRKSSEEHRRGSFASFDVQTPENETSEVNLQEIQLFDRESIASFNANCVGADLPCFFGDYPTVERYDGQKAAYEGIADFQDAHLLVFGDRNALVRNISCEGDDCGIREYTMFFGDVKVDVWITIAGGALDGEQRADVLFGTLQFK